MLMYEQNICVNKCSMKCYTFFLYIRNVLNKQINYCYDGKFLNIYFIIRFFLNNKKEFLILYDDDDLIMFLICYVIYY